jgi:GTP:adenosylcobinamide-phosphate guanylyltransferase
MKNYPSQIIIQAGGRGSRLRHHTWNKPKCLVSVKGKPILYHIFDKFPLAEFIVVGDYAFEQLSGYIDVNPPPVKITLLKAEHSGTAGGIKQAIELIPEQSEIIMLWSDLMLGELPEITNKINPIVFTTGAFTCRWAVNENGELVEVSGAAGIPGVFYFPDKSYLTNVPVSGEFVKWLSKNLIKFTTLDFPDLEELGDFSSIERANEIAGFSRYFNQVDICDTYVKKIAIDQNYQNLIEGEKGWYKDAAKLGFRRIPKVLNEDPFVIEKINGFHLYQLTDLSKREQRAVFADYLDTLLSLHDKGESEPSMSDIKEVYFSKTISRVESVSSIIPGFEKESVTVNGRKCKNLFHEKHTHLLPEAILNLLPKKFTPIHGDPTFSNVIVDDKLRTWFIDPRGYFAKKGIMGDPNYDFAKVYYSAIGGYDSFNRRKFKLHIDLETVEVIYEEPIFLSSAVEVFNSYFEKDMAKIKMIHSLIWLALSGYAKDDIDSVIGSFYLGLYWFEEGRRNL